MQEAEQQIYLDLVQELLKCPQGQEQKLLATKPELVNEKLIGALLIWADFLEQREGAASESKTLWLRGFARDLAGALGLELGGVEAVEQPDSEDCSQADLDFLNALMEAEREDSSQVQQLFAQNLQRLTPQLGAIMKWFIAQVLEQKPEKAEYYAAWIENIVVRLYRFPLGHRAQNLEIAIAGFSAVLAAWKKENNPEKWANTQYNLADAYSNRIRGDKAENLERSITCYQSALEIYTKADFPIQWAMTQNNLADAYSNRIRGDKAENLEQSIEGYQSVLEIRTKTDLPMQWAMTQNNLAIAYRNRIRGDKAENLELSIVCYQSALEIYTKADFPMQWAMTQNNLAAAYSGRISGDTAKNLECLIVCYQSALEIYTKADFPTQWAGTQNNLAIAYINRIRGDRAENLERSIECYQSALEIHTKADFPTQWAITQNNLANAYSDRIRGDKAENLECTIACYQSALEIHTKADFPIQWAMTQNNLAIAYSDRIRDDKAKNLECTIACYQSALEIYTKADLPLDWAMTQNNLAVAYRNRIRGDKAENLEWSIACYQSALEIRTKADLPLDWAQTQNNLAAAYSDRIRGDKAENLECTIACCQSALEIYTKADLPLDWAGTQNNLAIAYSERIRGDKAENLERSITCYQSALEIRTKADSLIEWAGTQYNLAIVYSKRIRGGKDENLERSIACCQSALEIHTKADFPIQWAATQNNLAIVYSKRIRGGKDENLERSIACCQSALEIITPENFPIECLQTAQNLGNLHFDAENWQIAINSYILAITAVELSRSWANSEQSKQEIIEKAIHVYFNLVQCCINTQQYDKALEYAERSKSRNLVELLATRDLYPKGDIPTDILSQLDTLRRQVLSEERRISKSSDFGNSIDPGSRGIANQNTTGIDPDRERLFTFKQDLDTLITDRVQPIDPSFQLTQQVQSIDFATMQSALPNVQTALLTWYISNSQIHTFLVTSFHNQPHVINSTPEQYEALDNLRANYLNTYRTDKQTWTENLPNLLQQISQILNLPEIITKLQQLNPDCNQIVLIPHRILHLLPLHALPLNEAGDCLLDLFHQGVSYAPSIQLLKLSQQWHRPALQRLFAIQNPTNDLTYTDVEVPAICNRFQPHVEIVKGKQADKAALSSESLSQANCVHFSCHGSFNFENPLASALILSGGKSDLDKCLTLGEIFQLDLRQCSLVTLSACETGLTDFRSTGDEYIGLPSGFLYAGSSNVVSSLWAVSDLSTTFLMIKFYQNLEEADSVAIALNQAQKWLRQITKSELLEWITLLNLGSSKKLLVESWTDTLKSVDDRAMLFQSPYHWAAFCAIG